MRNRAGGVLSLIHISLLLELRHRLHGGCIDFGRPEGDELFYEDAALTDEDVMEDFLLTGRVEDAVIRCV